MTKIYRIDDQKITRGVVECSDMEDARYWNKKNWGIFATVNDFNGARRAENLTRINAWFIDIDNCDKGKKLAEIKKAVVEPSIVVETKSGYHCYWLAKDATVHNFTDIEKRLIYYFNADKQVKDLPRILRVPNFYHCKDINNKFLVKTIYASEKIMPEKVMLAAFKPEPKKVYKKIDIKDVDFGDWGKLLKPEYIAKGERNGNIFKKGVFLKKLGATYAQVEDGLNWLNSHIREPIPNSELQSIIRGYHKWTS